MAGWKDGAESVVAQDGEFYVAPVGTALPVENSNPTAALPSTWVGGGFVSEEGFGHNLARVVEDIRAFQSLTPIRRVKTEENINLVLALMQWNETNLVTALGGGSVVTGGGFYTYRYPAPEDGLAEHACVLDIADGAKHYRFAFYRGNVSEAVESTFQRAQAALLPITFGVLAPEGGGSPGRIITDDPNFAVGS